MEEKIKNIISEYERCEKLKNTEIPFDAALKIFAPFGLTENYTESSLKKVYRDACNLYHPDKNSDLPEDIRDTCTSLFKLYNEANDKLLKKLKGIDDEKNQTQEVYGTVTSLLSKCKLENNSVSEINGLNMNNVELYDITNISKIIETYKRRVNDIIDKYLSQIQNLDEKTASSTTIMVTFMRAQEESSLAIKEYVKEIYDKYLKSMYMSELSFIEDKMDYANRKAKQIVDRITPKSEYALSLKATNEMLVSIRQEFISDDKSQEDAYIEDIEQKLNMQLDRFVNVPNFKEALPQINEEKKKIIDNCLVIKKNTSYKNNKDMYDNQMQMMIYGFTDKINKKIDEIKDLKDKKVKAHNSINKLREVNKGNKKILEVLNITEEAIDKMSSLSEVQPVINAMYDKISTIKKEDEKQSIVNELNLKLYKANEGKTAEEMMQNLKICTQVLTILPTLPDDKVKVLLGITFEDIEKDNLLLDSLLPKKADFHYDDGPELLYSGFEEQERVEKKKKDSASFTNPFVIPPKQKPVLEDDNKVKSNFERTYLEIFNKMAGTESDHQSPNAPVGPRK